MRDGLEDSDGGIRPIGGRVAGGAAMLMVANFLTRFVGVASVVVLARLLTPEDYGLVALAAVVFAFVQIITYSHLDNALIRLKAPTPAHYGTLFAMTALRGAALAAAMVATAGPIAGLFGVPALEPVLWALALTPAAEGLKNPYFLDHARAVRFRPQVALVMGAKIAAVAVSIALAFALQNYWALVAGMVATSVALAILTYVLRPTLPPRPTLRHWREFLFFGGWLSGGGVVSFLDYRADSVLIGRQLGVETLGFFSIADQLATVGTTFLTHPLVRAIYPGLAAVRDDDARFCGAYARSQRAIMAAVLPLGFGTALVAPELILVLAGPKWIAAAPIVQVLAPAYALTMFCAAIQALLMARDQTRQMFLRDLITLAISLPALVAGLWAFGLMGLVWARAASRLAGTLILLRLAGRVVGLSILAQLRQCGRSFIAVAAMCAAVLAVGTALPRAEGLLDAAALLAVKAGIGAAVYAAAHLAAWRAAGLPEDGPERIVLNVAAATVRKLRRNGA